MVKWPLKYRAKRLGKSLVAILAVACVFPGIDLAIYFWLHPSGFWQKSIFFALVVLCIWPMILGAIGFGVLVCEALGL